MLIAPLDTRWDRAVRHDAAMPKPPRSPGVDLLRIGGIVAIVAGHVWDNAFTRDALYTWHVPVFFFLAGYYWNQKRTVREELTKRNHTLLWPYLSWLVLIGVPFFAWLTARTGSVPVETIWKTVWGGAFAGRPFSAFWFVTALFFGALLYRWCGSLRWRGSDLRWLPWIPALLGLGIAYATDGLLAKLPLSAGVAVPCLIFVLAGSTAQRHRQSIRHPRTVGLALLAVSAALVIGGVSAPLDLKQADFGTPA